MRTIFQALAVAITIIGCAGRTITTEASDATTDATADNAGPDAGTDSSAQACCGPHLDDKELRELCCLELGLDNQCCD